MNFLQTEYNRLGDTIQRLYFSRSNAIKRGEVMPWDEESSERFVTQVRKLEAEKKELEDKLRRSVACYSMI